MLIIEKYFLIFLLGIGAQWLLIRFFHDFKIFQVIRDDGPKTHEKKKTTPTFGGIGLVFTLILGVFLLFKRRCFMVDYVILLALNFAMIGFLDDLFLLIKKGKRGMKGAQKFTLQLLVAGAFGLTLIGYNYFSSTTGLAKLWGFNQPLTYFLLSSVLMLGTVNSVNLTDGLDGLAGGVSLTILGAFLFLALNVHNIPLVKLIILLIIGVAAFLVFNLHPAKIFMGDTGSHFLGGAIAGLALVLHKEFLLILIGGVLVAEALSVMLQVASFQLFSKRIFKMSPLHHHFELSGWKEKQVVYTFWLVSALLAVAGVLWGRC